MRLPSERDVLVNTSSSGRHAGPETPPFVSLAGVTLDGGMVAPRPAAWLGSIVSNVRPPPSVAMSPSVTGNRNSEITDKSLRLLPLSMLHAAERATELREDTESSSFPRTREYTQDESRTISKSRFSSAQVPDGPELSRNGDSRTPALADELMLRA